MAWEVEIKGRVSDPAGMEERLKQRCRHLGPLFKEDLYFLSRPKGDYQFRLRREEGGAVVTVKAKEVRDGGEVNREVEFRVDDPASFSEFATLIGFREDYRKIKQGHRFTQDGALLELCEVQGLGWFLEVEIVLQEDDARMIQAAQSRVRELILSFGVREKDIEPRFYSELLKEARR